MGEEVAPPFLAAWAPSRSQFGVIVDEYIPLGQGKLSGSIVF